ncbi:MAG: cation:proton antiporter [Lachnospiraceae bacterium]|nr:cation:proton antiporter [Lachnospiraceae bacterium]
MISNSVTHVFFLIILVIMGLLLFACLIRAVRGPQVADRLIATNMMGTIVLVMICTLSLLLNEGFLVDVAIVYALLNFLSVVLITKLYMGAYAEKEADIDVHADLEEGIRKLREEEKSGRRQNDSI